MLDGLEGASSQAGATFDRQKVERILSGLGNRVFLLNNVHEDAPVVMQTRWALSYLRGPLTREQISSLMASRKNSSNAEPKPLGCNPRAFPANDATTTTANTTSTAGFAPVLPADIRQVYGEVSQAGHVVYRPALLGTARMHFIDAKAGVDVWKNVARLCEVTEGVPDDPWEAAEEVNPDELAFTNQPAEGAKFETPPASLSQTKSYTAWKTGLKNYLYREGLFTVGYCEALDQYAQPDEKPGDFQARLKHAAREQRELQVEKLRTKHATKANSLMERKRKAEQAVEREKAQSSGATLTAAVQFGTSVLGALFGRKLATATNVTRAATSVRSATRAAEQKGDVSRAQETVEAIQADIDALETELQTEIERITEELDLEGIKVTDHEVKPRKSDTTIDAVSLLWMA